MHWSCAGVKPQRLAYSHDQRFARASRVKVRTDSRISRPAGRLAAAGRALFVRPAEVIGIDHGLGYAALKNGSIDVKDAYSTDAKISENDLVALEDDLRFFPQYKRFFFTGSTFLPRPPLLCGKIEGTIDEKRMIRLNAEAERTKNYSRAADLYFSA